MAGSIGDLSHANNLLALRRVSSTWSDILDSTPSQILPQTVQVVKEWLGQSGMTCLLDISIQAPPDFPNLDLLTAILAEFMPTCRRWKNLALCVPAELPPMLLSIQMHFCPRWRV